MNLQSKARCCALMDNSEFDHKSFDFWSDPKLVRLCKDHTPLWFFTNFQSFVSNKSFLFEIELSSCDFGSILCCLAVLFQLPTVFFLDKLLCNGKRGLSFFVALLTIITFLRNIRFTNTLNAYLLVSLKSLSSASNSKGSSEANVVTEF